MVMTVSQPARTRQPTYRLFPEEICHDRSYEALEEIGQWIEFGELLDASRDSPGFPISPSARREAYHAHGLRLHDGTPAGRGRGGRFARRRFTRHGGARK